MKKTILVVVAVVLAIVMVGCDGVFMPAAEAAPDVVLPDDVVTDVARAGTFAFETYVSVGVSLSVTTVDSTSESSDGLYATRILSDAILASITDESGNLLFRGVFDDDGILEGVIGIPTATEKVFLTIEGSGIEDRTVEIDDPSELSAIVREMAVAAADASRGISTKTDGDGDGIPDVYDADPSTKTTEFQLRYPAEGTFNVAYEDLYPRLGDGDYNDFVVSYYVQVETNLGNDITAISGRAFARARAAGYDHEFGLMFRIPGLDGTMTSRSVPVMADGSFGAPIVVALNEPVSDEARLVIFPETKQSFTRPGGSVTPDNGYPDQVDSIGYTSFFRIDVDSAVGIEQLIPPFDPYLLVHNTGYDVHLIGESSLPGSANPGDVAGFRDANGFPWALLVPGYFAHPAETTSIMDAYPGSDLVPNSGTEAPGGSFAAWVESLGASDRDWYDYPMPGLVVVLP